MSIQSVTEIPISSSSEHPVTLRVAGAWTTLFILTIVYTINIADRYVLSTLIEPIKHDFNLSDTSVGFLTGVALAIFYVCAGLPLGALADKKNRKRLIAISIAIWSAMTLLCGMSSNFWQLLLFRIGVGVGEAGGTPASHSILSDQFPPKSRAFALSLFGIGASLGAWLGASGAGWLNDAYGWRAVLIIFGLCGLPISLIVWMFVKEPKRGRFDSSANLIQGASLRDTLMLIKRSKALLHLMCGATVITFWGWGILWWTPSFLVRSFSLTVGEAGNLLGPIHGYAGTALMLLTVWVMHRLSNKATSSQSTFVAWTTLVGTVLSIIVFLCDSLNSVHWALWLFIPVTYIYIGPTTGLVQNLFPPPMRAKGAAILLFVANFANLAIAPQLIGFLSDTIAPLISKPEDSLRFVLFGCAFTGFWAAYHYWAAAYYMKKELKQ